MSAPMSKKITMDETEKKAKLREKIEFQVACEEKAFRIVERLIDNPVDSQWFLDALRFLTPNHYNDIVEERAVVKLCGYPLCPKPLGKIPTQKYFISTKTNKVYDIEGRKNFCSACCYKSSQYIEKQISSVPVWSRKSEPRQVFDLLPLNQKTGKVGDEVQISTIDDMRSEVKKLERLDHYQQSLEQMELRNRETGNQRKQEVDKENQSKQEVDIENQRKQEVDIENQRKQEVDIENQRKQEVDTDNHSEGIMGKEKDETEQTSEYSEDCVYTLDKALSEMGIDDRGSSEEARTANEKITDNLGKPRTVKSDNERACEDIKGKGGVKPIGKVSKCVKSRVCETNAGAELKSEKQGRDVSEGDVNKDITEVPKKEKKKSKSKKSEQQSKTDYLMKLLDKRKALLSQMADIQFLERDSESQTERNHSQKQPGLNESSDTSVINEHIKDVQSVKEVDDSSSANTGKVIPESDLGNIKDVKDTVSNSVKDCVRTDTEENIIYGASTGSRVTESSEKLIDKISSNTEEHNLVKMKNGDTDGVTSDSGAKNSVKLTKSVSQSSVPLNLSVLSVVCRSLRYWITKETLEYLRREEVQPERSVDKTKFDKQYKALIAKVDAQERDFSQLIGEESIDDDSDHRPSAPAPHFDVLREEMARDQLRVREFMKGTFTYKQQKVEAPKAEADKVQIVLPTVDRYDQMVIRQRIVLDRINKVLPDLMNPLNLPVGDVFTDIRQLTETFHLTSENILFRPAEWNLVTLLILKMLSRKLSRLSTAFASPSAIRYIQTLLSGIQTDIQTLDKHVQDLCSV